LRSGRREEAESSTVRPMPCIVVAVNEHLLAYSSQLQYNKSRKVCAISDL